VYSDTSSVLDFSSVSPKGEAFTVLIMLPQKLNDMNVFTSMNNKWKKVDLSFPFHYFRKEWTSSDA